MSGSFSERLDRSLGSLAPAAVPILHEVFDGPRDQPGPIWVTSPPPSLDAIFWRTAGVDLHPHAVAWKAIGFVDAGRIHDLFDERVPGLEGASGEAALYFVDHAPAANWAHPCEYVLLSPSGDVIARAAHMRPPASGIRLDRLRRAGTTR